MSSAVNSRGSDTTCLGIARLPAQQVVAHDLCRVLPQSLYLQQRFVQGGPKASIVICDSATKRHLLQLSSHRSKLIDSRLQAVQFAGWQQRLRSDMRMDQRDHVA